MYQNRLSDRFPIILVTFLAVAAVVILTISPWTDALGLLAAVIGTGFFIFAATRWPSIGLVLLIAYLLRASLALFGYYAFELPEATADAKTFDRFALTAAGGGLAGIAESFTTNSYFFAWLMGVMYWVVGYSPLLAIFVNVFLGTGVVLNVYLLTRELRRKQFALVSAFIAAFFPILLMYSAVLLREAGWVFFFTLTLLLFTIWYKHPSKVIFLVGSVLSGLITGMFHPYGAAALAILLPFALVKLVWSGLIQPEKRGVSIAALGILTLVVAWVVVTGIGLGNVGASQLNFSWLTWFQEAANYGRAAYPEFLIMSSWAELFWKLPARIAYLLFTPFPWMIEAPLDVIGAVDAILYLLVAVLLAVHAKAILRDPRLVPLAAVLVLLIVVVSLTVGNYGTAVRHRAKLVALMIVLLPVERFTTSAVDWVTGAWTTIQKGSWFRRLVPAGVRSPETDSTQIDSRD